MAGWALWACALPQNNPPPESDGGTEGGTTGKGGSSTGGASGTATGGTAGGTVTGGSDTGGATTGGSTTGGSTTGGSTTGGSTMGGAGGSTGGSMAGTSTGGTMAGTSSGGTAGTTAGTSAGGKGGTAGTVGMGGSMAGTASGGKGGSAGTMGGGGSGPTICPCIVHRYSFSGSGTSAVDSIGGANGTITGGTQANGVVTLAGGTSNQYVTLPNGILGGLTNATFEAWVTWTGGTANWQRIFDFGNNDGMGMDPDQGTGNTTAQYIFLTPRAQMTTSSANCMGAANFPRVAVTGSGPSMESCVVSDATFPAGSAASPTHVAVTIGTTMTLYVNGTSVGTPIAPAIALSGISESHNWLGRSQFYPDTEYAGTISEFRIYNTARSSAQIAASNTAGPDSPPAQ